MKMPLKNLRISAAHVLASAYPLTPCMARSNLMRQFLRVDWVDFGHEYIYNYEKPKPPLETSNPFNEFIFLCEHK
jgi:hypothetical protein